MYRFFSILLVLCAGYIIEPVQASQYETPDLAAAQIENTWAPILESNPNRVQPGFHSQYYGDEIPSLSAAVRAMPTTHAVEMLPWFESSGALRYCPSTTELINLVKYLASYPLDSFKRVSVFIQETGLLPKCGLLDQLQFIFRFAKSFNQKDLATIQQILTEGKVFDNLQTGEQAAYLLKDLIQDEDIIRNINSAHRWSSKYPLDKLKEVVTFLHETGITNKCGDGIVLREIIASLRFFDLSVLNSPRKQLPGGSYYEFALALKDTRYWDKRFEAYVLRSFPNKNQVAQFVENRFGQNSPLTLDYFKQAIEEDIENLLYGIASEPNTAALRKRMHNSLVRVTNLAAAKHLQGFLSSLKSINRHYLKHVLPVMLEIADRGIYLDQEGFERVVANICAIPKYTYEFLHPLIIEQNLIGLCNSKIDFVRVFFGLSDFSENEARGFVSWFTHHKIRDRLVRANDFLDVLAHVQVLLKEGAVFSNGTLDVSKVNGDNYNGTNDALRFLEIENMLLQHGDGFVYTPAFGDVLSSCLSKSLDRFANSDMCDLPMSRNRNDSRSVLSRHPGIKIISNNKGFRGVDETIVTRPEDTMLTGAAFMDLKLGDDARPEAVGYNVHLPDGEIKAVRVEVYGGFDTLKEAYSPGEISPLASYLLSNGVACISLNLPDLLRLTVFQADMPEGLHTSIHECIHAFYKVLKEHPEKLHPELSRLKGKDLFLYGASFGGGNVIRHSKKYPNTFKGYISHDGQFWYAKPHMNARNESELVQISQKDSFLLLQNFDDKCVHNFEATNLFHEMRNRSLPVQLLITDRGNPMLRKARVVTSAADSAELREDPVYKGHFMPLQKELYVRTVLDFIIGGPDSCVVSDWRLLRYNVSVPCLFRISALTNTKAAFMTVASRLYRSSLLAPPVGDIDPASIRVRETQEQAWRQFYEPLFRASTHLVHMSEADKVRSYSVPEDHLTDENVDRALTFLLPVFVDHLHETETAFSALKIDSIKLQQEAKNIISPALRQAFRALMEQREYSPIHQVIKTCWILGNPQLAPLENPYLNEQTLKDAKAAFLKFVSQDTRLRKTAMRQKVVEAVKQIKNRNPQALEVYERMGIN